MRADYKCPFMLLSATMEETSLDRILGWLYDICSFYTKAFSGTLEIDKADLEVLYKCPDRPNIYCQRRMLKKPVDVMYVSLNYLLISTMIIGACARIHAFFLRIISIRIIVLKSEKFQNHVKAQRYI